ncbi:MAG: hypothetical protein ACREE9_00615 [Stellaceae bacterium]
MRQAGVIDQARPAGGEQRHRVQVKGRCVALGGAVGDALLGEIFDDPLRRVTVAADLDDVVGAQRFGDLAGRWRRVERRSALVKAIEHYAVDFAVRDGGGESVSPPATRIAERDIGDARLRRANSHIGVDRRLDDLAVEEGGEIIALAAEVLGARSVGIAGKLALDQPGIERRVKLKAFAHDDQNVVAVAAEMLSYPAVEQARSLVNQ